MNTIAATDPAGAAATAQHAREQWAKSHDVAWLLAALALTSPGDADAASLAAAAAAVPADNPGWLSAQYHQMRLTIAGADPAVLRKRLDAILALGDLSANDRAVFTAERLQVSADLADFARLSTRRPICASPYEDLVHNDQCGPDTSTAGVYQASVPVGFGEDARASIDRMPLAMRMALGRNAALPAPLRLDVALGNFARAVLLQDDGAINAMASDLAVLLPQLKADWLKVTSTPPGPDKRFAEAFGMARIPGLAPDLAYQTRPERKIAEFQGHWVDWVVLAKGHTAGPGAFPDASVYQGAEMWFEEEVEGGKGPGPDLACLGQCGAGAFPLHLSPFVAAAQGAATAERAYFFSDRSPMDSETYPPTPPPAAPAGAQSVWEDMLTYARAHPADPRAPEALYWLIHITRWGVTRDHLGHRAFTLLHTQYPTSPWAKRSPYFYD